MKTTKIASLAILLAISFSFAKVPPTGRFVGNVVAEWSEDSRTMKLLKPFAYIGPNAKQWKVPKGAIVDGASIPRLCWTLIGGPYEGPYRKASVVHDYYCVTKTEKWEDVHNMFYDACITEGSSLIRAKVMWAAVYGFGPRWKVEVIKKLNGTTERNVLEFCPSTNEDQLKGIKEWIERENPDLNSIKDTMDKITTVKLGSYRRF